MNQEKVIRQARADLQVRKVMSGTSIWEFCKVTKISKEIKMKQNKHTSKESSKY